MKVKDNASKPLSEMESLVRELHKTLLTNGGSVSADVHPLKANIWADSQSLLRYKVINIFEESLRVIEIATDNSSNKREINRFLFEEDIKQGVLVPWRKATNY